jgi:hypothetical protein
MFCFFQEFVLFVVKVTIIRPSEDAEKLVIEPSRKILSNLIIFQNANYNSLNHPSNIFSYMLKENQKPIEIW